MKNSGEPPAKRLKIDEEENIVVEVDVLDEEEMEEEDVHFDNDVLADEDIFFDAEDIDEEDLEEEEEEIVNDFDFNNVSAEECAEFLMALHLQNYEHLFHEQLFHVLEEEEEEEEEEAED